MLYFGQSAMKFMIHAFSWYKIEYHYKTVMQNKCLSDLHNNCILI